MIARTLALVTNMLLLCACGMFTGSASGAQLRVKGQPTFVAVETQPNDTGVKVVGSLRDEANQPVSQATIQLSVPRSSVDRCYGANPGLQAADTGTRVRHMTPLGAARGTKERTAGRGQTLTSTVGEFCFTVHNANGQSGELTFAGNRYFAQVKHDVSLIPKRRVVEPIIELESRAIKLDSPSVRLRVRVKAEQARAESYAVRLELTRTGKRQALSSPRQVTARRPATFDIAPTEFGVPGAVLLHVFVQSGNQLLGQATSKLTVVGTVDLAWAKPMTSARTASGFTTVVAVSAHRHAVDEGWVEAHVRGQPVGIAPVHSGSARIDSRFAAPRRKSIPFSVRYLPANEWYQAGQELSVDLMLLPPSAATHLPWVAVGLVAAYWVVRTWRRPTRRTQTDANANPERAGSAREGIQVLSPTQRSQGWQGTLRDAHTGKPIVGGSLRVIVPALKGEGLAAKTTSGSDGSFSLPDLKAVPEGSRLVVDAPEYSRLVEPVPPPGRIRIGISARRRSLLDALADWAHQMGKPWHTKPSSTPREVAGVAEHQQFQQAAQWAIETERAAFGLSPPDEATEQRIRSMTPPLDRPHPLKR